MARTAQDKKEARVEFRVQSAIKELLERAASLKGQTLSAYALATLVEDARRIIERASLIEVTQRDHRHLLRLLDSDQKPNRALREAAQDYRSGPPTHPDRSDSGR